MLEFIKILNENIGVTMITSTIGFALNEYFKMRTIKKVNKSQFIAENINVKTLKKEDELYLILSNFCLSDDSSDENCIKVYNQLRQYIINNDLFLRDELSSIGNEFADYIIEDIANNRDYAKQTEMLKRYKKIFRS